MVSIVWRMSLPVVRPHGLSEQVISSASIRETHTQSRVVSVVASADAIIRPFHPAERVHVSSGFGQGNLSRHLLYLLALLLYGFLHLGDLSHHLLLVLLSRLTRHFICYNL